MSPRPSYARSAHFNVGLFTRRKRRSKTERASRNVHVRIASNGGLGPFAWRGGVDQNMMSFQRTSERARREAFVRIVNNVAPSLGRMSELTIYPVSGKFARPTMYVTDDVDIQASIAARDGEPGLVYQAALCCVASFPTKAAAKQFQMNCDAILTTL